MSRKKADLFPTDDNDEDDNSYIYTRLTGAALDIAFHTSLNAFGTLGQTDYASFQPCFEKSQDRVVVEDVEIGGEVWRLRCIFDGARSHANSSQPALMTRPPQATPATPP